MASTAKTERPEVIHRALIGPKAPMAIAANAGPTTVTTLSTVCCTPTNDWRSRRSRSATAGSRVSRAVMPGTSPTAPSTPNRTNQPKESPATASTTGRAATQAADTRSDATATSLRFRRSRSAPPTMPASTWGTAQIRARHPAASTSPVLERRTRGMTTPATEFPMRDAPPETM